jgi:DNA-binding transcriptional ArsR family regulator
MDPGQDKDSLGVPVCQETHQKESPPKTALTLPAAQQMAEFFAVLADPTRLRLISILAEEESCVCDLAARLSITDSAVSHQLRALRTNRLVSYRKEGRQVFYRLHDHHVVELYAAVREHLEED